MHCDKSGKCSLLSFIIPFTSSYTSLYSYSISFPSSQGSPLMEAVPHKLVALLLMPFSSRISRLKLYVIFKMWGDNALTPWPHDRLVFFPKFYFALIYNELHQLFLSSHPAHKLTKTWCRGEKWNGLAQASENQNRKELGLDWGLKQNAGMWQGSTKLNPTVLKLLWALFSNTLCL